MLQTFQGLRIFTTVSRKGDSETKWAGRCFTIHCYRNDSNKHIKFEYSLQQSESIPPKHMYKSGKPRPPRLSPLRTNLTQEVNCTDGLKIVDGETSNIVVLQKGGDGTEISIYNSEVPHWSRRHAIKSLKLFNSLILGTNPAAARRAFGLHRVLDPPKSLYCLENSGVAGEFDILDGEGLRHRVQVQLQARDEFAARALSVCEFVLSSAAWEDFKTLWWIFLDETQDDDADKREWTALVITLLSLAVPLLSSEPKQTTSSSPNEPIALRQTRAYSRKSESSNTTSANPWESMWNRLKHGADWKSWPGVSWDWVDNQEESHEPMASNGLLISAPNYQHPIRAPSATKNNFIPHCISIVRCTRRSDQVKPHVERIIGMKRQNGVNLVKLVIALHLLREEQKLSVIDQEAVGWGRDLGPVLAQIGGWLGWDGWSWKSGGFFDLEKAGENHYNFEQGKVLSSSLPVTRLILSS